MRRSIVLAHLLVAACRMVGVEPVGETRPFAEALPERFRVVCWNVQKGKNHHFGKDLELGGEA